MRVASLLSLASLTAIPLAAAADEPRPFHVRAVDAGTKRPIPLVTFTTTHGSAFITDNLGVAAIDDPELVGHEVFLTIGSHGYRFPKDGFGFAGKRFTVAPGGSAEVELERVNLAERLHRITGAGRFAESLKAGLRVDDPHPIHNALVSGCDSVLNAVFGGRLFWIWGDTSRLRYPLGNFHASGATTALDTGGRLDPESGTGIVLEYFTDEAGFAAEMAKMAGEGPTWLTALATLPDAGGRDHLVATYLKIRAPMEVYERGLCEFDPATNRFRKVFTFPEDALRVPEGHPFRHQDDGGREVVLVGDPFPKLQIPARYEAWLDPSTYEAVDSEVALEDAGSGNPVNVHRGSVAWNAHLGKWIAIFVAQGGKDAPSFLGEVFYAEADAPTGPWRRAVKVVTHDGYSFYNPKLHPEFGDPSGRVVYFEGTYARTFSRTVAPTPRYDYNQVLYRLDLEDPRLRRLAGR